MRRYKGMGVGDEGCPQAGLAAPRDAIWYMKPGIARRRHVVASDGGSECCGMPLILEMSEAKVLVPPWLRCRRNGCKDKWPPRSLRQVMRGERLPAGAVITVASACCQAAVLVRGASRTGYTCEGCGTDCLSSTYEVTEEAA